MHFPMNFAKFLKTSFLQNTYGRLLLIRKDIWITFKRDCEVKGKIFFYHQV